MKRRSFIKSVTALGTTSMLPLPGFSLVEKPKFKLGLQLFTIHEEMMKDAIASLRAAKAMGYQDFEIFGFDEKKGTCYGYKSSQFGRILDDLGLTVSSGHFGFSPYLDQSDEVLKRFVDQCISGARALNMKYITWPWLAPDQRSLDHFKLLANKLNIIGEQVAAAGLGFAYHNHDFEFIDYNGENGFDIILNETDPALVKIEMDIYWVVRASRYAPSELVSRQPGRYALWHIKDMDKTTNDYTELGNGAINYAEVLPDPIASGLEFFYLEQGGNYTHSAMKSMADSAAYFKKHLQKYL
ncbi:sugar phosphate isomerase/epimerase family protein [Parapedobacter deserti]|uniref:Sugar phosphate isomerase/epimerase family protein n=1 Tax=Parapedobacter deserti TaxID=1912957 RepID=A0ABV7JHC4_9SPHI